MSNERLATFTLDGQLLGVPVSRVQEVLGRIRLCRVPLAPPVVAGLLNLRGQIVTVFELRTRLDRPPRPEGQPAACLVLHSGGELLGLMVDEPGDVIEPPTQRFERPPPHLPSRLASLSTGIYKLEGRLLLALDVERVVGVS